MPNLVTAVLAGRFLRWRIPYPTHQTDNISSRILTARICWYESSAQAEKVVAPKTVARSLHQELFEFRQMNLTRKL
ncbi:TPA: hypothetical protein ACE77M_000925 [Neisseria gonorrhoeae]